MNKKKPAILVDSDLYNNREAVRNYINSRAQFADLILLVTNPHDFDKHHTMHDFLPEDFEWTAIIQNTGDLSDYDFKVASLNAVQNLSNMIPAMAFDDSPSVQSMYEDNGVLVTVYEFGGILVTNV